MHINIVTKLITKKMNLDGLRLCRKGLVAMIVVDECQDLFKLDIAVQLKWKLACSIKLIYTKSTLPSNLYVLGNINVFVLPVCTL